MSYPFRTVSGPGRVFRVAREPDAWEWPDWAFAGADHRFHGRYDDPEGLYRVLYVSSQRVGAFVESLANFRPDVEVYAATKEIQGDEALMPAGQVPGSWRGPRVIGEALLKGEYADVGHTGSLHYLREKLAQLLAELGLDDLDASTIRLKAPKTLTQRLSRLVYECSTSEDKRAYAGIYYRSRLGDDIENWAVFEPATRGVANPVTALSSQPIAESDPDLANALNLLHLHMPGVTAEPASVEKTSDL